MMVTCVCKGKHARLSLQHRDMRQKCGETGDAKRTVIFLLRRRQGIVHFNLEGFFFCRYRDLLLELIRLAICGRQRVAQKT